MSANLMSLSRVQIIYWFLVIFSAQIVVVMPRVPRHIASLLAVTVDNYLWAILGISTASFVGAPLVLCTQTDKSRSPNLFRAASDLSNADMLKLFAVSHGGYLTFKTVGHPESENP